MKNLKKLLFLVALFHCVSFNGFAQISEEEALSKFVSAGLAYKDERYDEAIAKYNEILQGGRENGAVYYNLGNSYFRKGDLGRTVLNYERAKRLIPRDSDLNFNDRYVSFRIDRYGNVEKTRFFAGKIESFINFYTMEEMALIITGAILILGGFFLAALYLGWPKPFKQGVIVFLFIVVTVYVTGIVLKVQYARNMAVVLISSESYFEPRADSTVHFKLSEGTKARVIRTEGAWVKIERQDGKTGWIPSDVLEEI